MTDHLSPTILNALVDGELSGEQLASANQHLAGCSSCTSQALYQSLLKSATAKAGQRYALPTDLQERLMRHMRQEGTLREASQLRREPSPLRGFRSYGWAAACALLLVFASVFVVQRVKQQSTSASSEYAALATEVCDQHIAALAANSPPQVISSDRHTVKPWFQGKLPFSFNLPENLPSGTTLDGANLTYIHNRPTAQLLYSIGKHRVSVYLQETTGVKKSFAIQTEHSGFHVASLSTEDLDVIAVSDVDPVHLSDLVSMIGQAQTGALKQSK
jgi:anti-sigma factor RsiW